MNNPNVEYRNTAPAKTNPVVSENERTSPIPLVHLSIEKDIVEPLEWLKNITYPIITREVNKDIIAMNEIN